MTTKILNDLINNVNHENLGRFFRERNGDFKPETASLSQYDDERFFNGSQLGVIPFELHEKLIVCAFDVKGQFAERSGKKAQYDLAKKIIRDFNLDAGIFVFLDEEGNFRFSLVFSSPEGTKVKYSNFKRFTYYVSPQLTNKTFKQQMSQADFSSLDSIIDAFSVEKVTKEFFTEFSQVFDRTRQEFETANQFTVCTRLKAKYSDEEYEEQINKFVFTFLGRIIFLYFLLRKGWIENKQDFVRQKIEDTNNMNLYQEFFVPLFFDVFAKEPHLRPPEIQAQYQDTPYLNGGLFEHSDLEAEMEKEGLFILINDEFLRGIILNYFEAYNFTVDENAPDDQEVSIDPEMLGKVFENTLAEEIRNKRGTFYTPREVVHFMVKDALKQYLHNETGISLQALQKLIYSDDKQIGYLNPTEIRLLDAKLEGVKIFDPAVGSAAFPVEMMQVMIDLRKRLNVRVGININEVALKKHLIKNNLYGVDIDPGAIEIAKLRLWLALIVDYDKTLVEPLPNLDFQFRVGNSLQEKIDDIDIFNQTLLGQMDWLNENSEFERMKSKMINIKDAFYKTADEHKRRQLKADFDNLEHEMILVVLKNYDKLFKEQLKNRDYRKTADQITNTSNKIENLQQRIKDGTYKLLKPDFHFSEVFDRKDENGQRIGGFDIVIGNPPYGVKTGKEIRDWHQLGSDDSYGIFISTAMKRFLKPRGVLEFIVSDTWLTIKTHKALREQVLDKTLHKIVLLHKDSFDATVNACVVSLSNTAPVDASQIVAADLTNLSTRNDVDKLRALLYHLEGHIGDSTPNYGVYTYDQRLVNTNSNKPIFVGSPKLFAFMNDVDGQTLTKELSGKRVNVRQVNINDQIIVVVRLGDIAEVKQGLATGDNKAYLYQNPAARGRYQDITRFKKYLLTESELNEIANNEGKRVKIIESGIHKTRDEEGFDEGRWFGGRYIVPYDKGGASDTAAGWLPNYYVPTDYFIDWSTWAVNRMKTLTIAERIRNNKEKKISRPYYETQVAGVFRNVEFYFTKGFTLSYTGQYAPNLRLNSIGVFDVGGSSFFSNLNEHQVLGNFVSKIVKYLGKNYIDHSVNFQVDENKELPMLLEIPDKVVQYVQVIIEKQKRDPKYPYMEYEQKEIDKEIYKLYGLNKEDIKEVETWYARRYPKLAHLSEIEDSRV